MIWDLTAHVIHDPAAHCFSAPLAISCCGTLHKAFLGDLVSGQCLGCCLSLRALTCIEVATHQSRHKTWLSRSLSKQLYLCTWDLEALQSEPATDPESGSCLKGAQALRDIQGGPSTHVRQFGRLAVVLSWAIERLTRKMSGSYDDLCSC